MTDILLASRSPRRGQLLQQIGVTYSSIDVEVDESWDGREAALDYVRRLALAKARAGRDAAGRADALVLGADTAVTLDGRILGKAEDRSGTLAMLAQLSGRDHQVCTAVALVAPAGETVRVNVSRVRFRTLSQAETEAYWATGEPLGKAGGYAIQGVAAAFIEYLEGSYSGVMGLPLFETAELLSAAGVRIPADRQPG